MAILRNRIIINDFQTCNLQARNMVFLKKTLQKIKAKLLNN